MGHVTGWKLAKEDRERLLARFPPKYDEVVADHVTLKVGGTQLPPTPEAKVVGRAEDESLECLVVELDGTTDRPDGSTYHITWSLAEGRDAKESNDVIAARGWTAFDLPMPVMLTPARWP